MKQHGTRIAVALLAAAGCAASGGQSEVTVPVAQPGTQQETAERARDQRTLSYALREMADRRQMEADLIARDRGPNDPAVERKRQLAEDLREAADEAEGEARQLRMRVPHGMVQ
ncbi:MAG TPA: hypothetical protein VFS39_16505 [Nitrospira sp.]|nr:hypothetical protein [Nitrospira sp.]